MKRLMVAIGASLCCGALTAGGFKISDDRQPLWPDGKIPDYLEQQIAAPVQEASAPGFDRAAHRMPYLEWSEAPKGKKTDACMILISGGGYGCTCDGPAFKALERKLLDNGITCVWLWYRTPRPQGLAIYQTAWEDGQRAVRLVRREAEKRGFNPEKIGVLGCSAGSHLCLLLGLNSQTPAYQPVDDVDKIPCHVNWAIPMCPAYPLTDGLTGQNTTKGNGPDVKLDTIFKFDAKTCPMCFFHGGDDPYSPIGSTRIYRELRKRKVPAELHLDAGRGHGPVGAAAFERALEFMRQMEFIGKLGRTESHDHRWMPGATIRTEKEMLWPEGKIPDASPNHAYKPYLVWFVPEKLKTKAIQIVYPGGGYGFCNFNGEGTPVAHYLNGKGMTCVVVMYRCPRPVGKPKHFSGWQDAQRAIRMVRAEAPARGLDPDRIGVMGFSAGGHLTLMTATNTKTPAYAPVDGIDQLPCTVQWACPIYPAYALTDGDDKPNAKGGNELDVETVPEFSFDDATPPMCFVHGDADGWAAMNSVVCWEKLRRMGIQSDLHTLAKRGHCFQMNSHPGTGSYTWLDRLWEFYSRKGFNK